MAKLVRGKTFMVIEENDYSLENLHSSMLVYLYYQLTRSYIHGETLTVE